MLDRSVSAITPNRPWAALSVLATLLLGGCEAAVGPLAAAGVGSVITVGRDPADVAVSLASGRDCSIVRLAKGQSYCRPIEAPPAPPSICTRSLGTIECWDKPNPFGYHQREVADGPTLLTATQEQNRTARWPGH